LLNHCSANHRSSRRNSGGTTGINNQLIPLVTVLQTGGVTVAVYNPTVNNDPQGTDMKLVAQSPLYDATTTYPGPPAETGQFNDSHSGLNSGQPLPPTGTRR